MAIVLLQSNSINLRTDKINWQVCKFFGLQKGGGGGRICVCWGVGWGRVG